MKGSSPNGCAQAKFQLEQALLKKLKRERTKGDDNRTFTQILAKSEERLVLCTEKDSGQTYKVTGLKVEGNEYKFSSLNPGPGTILIGVDGKPTTSGSRSVATSNGKN